MRTTIKASAGLLALVVAAVCLTVPHQDRPYTLKPEDLFDTKKTNVFSRIEFDGQQRKVIVTNKTVLGSVADAFSKQQDRGPRGGTTYDCLFTLENGSSAKAFVYVYDGLDGFSVAIPRRSGLLEGDPHYFNVRFSNPVDRQVRKVFELLTDASNAGKQITF